MTATELFEMMAPQSWNYSHRWDMVLSANEWVLGRDDAEAQIPAQYALALLVDHFGAEKVHNLVNAETIRARRPIDD
jgi:hypothetical protein